MSGRPRLVVTLVAAFVTAALCAGTTPAMGQGRGRGAAAPARSARESAPIDLTGYWVSFVTEDWRFRMMTPPRGDYARVPLTPEGRTVADGWNAAADEAAGNQCKAFGAAAIMRVPGRFHITWQDESTLRIDADAGTQTRVLRFAAPAPPPERTWQGHSTARWDAAAASLNVVTTNMRAGYLRWNGVPYSENATLTENFDVAPYPDGGQLLIITTIVTDPQDLQAPFIVSSHFKKEKDESKMESNAMHRDVVGRAVSCVVVLLIWTAAPRSASAQFEFSGSWNPIGTEDASNDSLPVDYMGLPLTDEARALALTYSESRVAMVDHQCEAWPAPYLATGPFGLKVSRETEPIKGTDVSYTIGGWSDRLPTVIWMDGRPHPSKYAEHWRSGFTTGRWEGNTLVTSTTHMKAGNLRKTGPPMSDQATMTVRYYRHGDILTLVAVVEDAVYLTEPLVWTKSYQVSAMEIAPQVLACITTFEGTTPGEVPHYAPDKNPYVDEMTRKYGIPREAVLGFPETLYPEYRKKMKTTSGR